MSVFRHISPIVLTLFVLFNLAGCAIAPHQSRASSPELEKVLAAAQGKIDAGRAQAYSPVPQDIDGDGLDAATERRLGTRPLSPDSDMDGLPDGYEVSSGSDPLRTSPEHHSLMQERVAACAVDLPSREMLLLVPNTISCTMTGFNATTCTATCAGTCCLGTVSCSWGWDPVVWGIDKAVGAPCPGWICECP